MSSGGLDGTNGSSGNIYQLGAPRWQRNPPDFHEAKLFTSDFDGTKFITDEPAPGGVGVEGAYEVALDDIGGPKAADAYREQGGHNGRTPLEIVEDCMPEAEEIDLPELTARLVAIKLEQLLANIGQPLPDGSIWPRPTEGFLDLWALVYKARASGAFIDTADISAGHTEFLLRTYEAWGIQRPDILVTSDTIHRLSLTSLILAPSYAKPEPGIMTCALEEWFVLYGWANHDTSAFANFRNRVLYVGDNRQKDGGLAQNSGVDFVHIPINESAEAWRAVASHLAIGDIALKGAAEL